MRYEAAIFDLFGTLTDEASETFPALLQREGVLGPLTGGRGDTFARLWEHRDARRMRTLGILDNSAAAIRSICAQMQCEPLDAVVERAVELRVEYCRDSLIERPGTLETLAAIRNKGVKIGLMTTCCNETASLWPQAELSAYVDEALFSCQVGLAKPHARFYELVCERLDVSPRRCLYVGDGHCKELTGAVAAGMDAALIVPPTAPASLVDRPEVRQWSGTRIESVDEVLDLLVNGTALNVA